MSKPDPIRRTSKYLSRVLRHEPGHLPIKKDGGWANLDTLLRLAPAWVTRENVIAAVKHNDKQRFTLDGNRIRANQGHTIDVDLGFEEAVPPEFLYHGTYPRVVDAIWDEGLKRMKRHHVHMADNTDDAATVGRRSGTPVVFRIAALHMHREGFVFYRSSNGVWLTDHVPPAYLERLP